MACAAQSMRSALPAHFTATSQRRQRLLRPGTSPTAAEGPPQCFLCLTRTAGRIQTTGRWVKPPIPFLAVLLRSGAGPPGLRLSPPPPLPPDAKPCGCSSGDLVQLADFIAYTCNAVVVVPDVFRSDGFHGDTHTEVCAVPKSHSFSPPLLSLSLLCLSQSFSLSLCLSLCSYLCLSFFTPFRKNMCHPHWCFHRTPA